MELILAANETRTGFSAPSDFARARLMEWLKKYPSFKVTPIVKESRKMRGYLHGAVEPAWCKWQYGIDPRDPGRADQRHFLFLRDFNAEIIEDRNGNPERVPQSSRGKLHELLDAYTRYAEENGAPIPNPELYKLYRDEWSMDMRFASFHDWLEFLGIEEDAMPTPETLSALNRTV